MTVPSPTRPADEQRIHDRRRTRLRPVKLISRGKRFLVDGSAIDLSEGGVRIRWFGEKALPATLLVFDEADDTLRPASIVWRVRDEIGLRFTGSAEAIGKTDKARLGGRYYALG
ncbi:hypothetical protein U0C82_09475 [Fulvimarina sp. 2208YS6-2-32]|uniref:PilZ domain-containing protein n=1 Tax=Fulvimarina uroteuthidis TaxID=3098149 RepID=A0ABU5I1X9_9HYPH|nr:hypothetical protein [Fulvimarina sp. 2208YS6-2-32]MDY8109369.1 hypothetical protein [Fulvimarina sp. 2208YS6-2-32]